MIDMMGPLVLFAAVMSLTPGPNVIMVTASAANFGFRRTIPHMLGITLGFAILLLAVGFGLAGLFSVEPRAHTTLKLAGSAYLLYLAWRIGRAGPGDQGATRARPIGFIEASLFQWINPKGWVIAIGAIAAFTTVGGDVVVETLVITVVNAATCLVSVALWSGLGTIVGRFLVNPSIRSIFNWSMAGLLALSLVPVLMRGPT